MKYNNKLINKAIKLYKYDEVIDFENEHKNFYDGYSFSFNNYKKNKYNFDNFWNVLQGSRTNYSHHLAAKNLLYQNNSDCWKYFERTALFWSKSTISYTSINSIKTILEYCMYIERFDLVDMLYEKILYFSKDLENEKDYVNQKIYPSAFLIFFLIEKRLGKKTIINEDFIPNYGVYQPIIEKWNDFSQLPISYWDDLCNYHLTHMGLQSEDNYELEEFLGCGLIPMELINIIKVRKHLEMSLPMIENELFLTPMSKFPKIPTEYDENLDVKYQLVKNTVETKKKYSYDEIINSIEEKSSQKINVFL